MASPPETLDEPATPQGGRKQVRRNQIRTAMSHRHAKPAIMLLALALVLLLANGRYGWTSGVPGSDPNPTDAAAPAVIDEPFAPKALRPLSPTEAEAWNRQIPQTGQVSAATPIVVTASDSQSFMRSLQCMTEAIYYEAGNEPVDGQRAVAQVILNRMRSPVYPHSVCGVVYQGSERKTGCQFTFTCDGALARAPSPARWTRASGIAAAALSGSVYAPVGWATNYHADYVVPYWAQSLLKLTTVGRHIFYGWKGVNGTGAAFTSRYAGVEPAVLGALSLGTQQPVAGPTAPGAVVSVTSEERPLIRFGVPDSGEASAQALPGKSAEALQPTVSVGSRWVIVGPAKSSETRTAGAQVASEAAKLPPQAAQPTSGEPKVATKQASSPTP